MSAMTLHYPQAFPVPAGNFSGGESWTPELGMSLRDYFAAHAPIEPWGWFRPTMPPRPAPDWGEIPNNQRGEVDPLNWQEITQWDIDYKQERDRQWPYSYAAVMLAERAK